MTGQALSAEQTMEADLVVNDGPPNPNLRVRIAGQELPVSGIDGITRFLEILEVNDTDMAVVARVRDENGDNTRAYFAVCGGVIKRTA